MSFRPVLGRSSARRVLRGSMPSYSGSMTISTTALPSRSSTSPMSPIAHARHAHRLALAGGDGLRGRELGLQRAAAPPPTGSAALLVEDVQRDAGGDQHQAEHGEEVLRVLADRALTASPAAIRSTSAASASSPATSSSSSRPSALSSSRSQSTALRARPARSAAWNAGVPVSTWRCGGGAGRVRAQVRRLLRLARHVGASSGGRFAAAAGWRRSAARAWWRSTPGRSVTRFLPPAASTRNHAPLASPERLSPARPGSGFGRLLVDLALGRELLVGHRVHRPRLDDLVLAARRAADLAVAAGRCARSGRRGRAPSGAGRRRGRAARARRRGRAARARTAARRRASRSESARPGAARRPARAAAGTPR